MIVDFEGIDGSGKTTLSNRLAARLKAEGRHVVHLREGGKLGSRLSADIRAFTRDQRQLGLGDRAELLLYAAREAQLHDELTRPALASGALVIADRSVYSHLAHAAAGRGLPAEEVEAVLRFAGKDAWPDIVVLVDCDPALAKARKRCRKVVEPASSGSRKGLAGEGFSSRVREALLELAARDPARWIVLRNDGATLDELDAIVAREVAARLGNARPAPSRDALHLAPTPPMTRRAAPEASVRVSGLRERFFATLEPLAAREPGVAAFFLAGIALPEADALRERLVFAAPEMVLDGLAGDDSEAAWRLRRMLATRHPAAVLRSLRGLPPTALEQAESLRKELAPAAPEAAAESVKGETGALADGWLVQLAERAPEAVLEALAGRDDAFAWALRDGLGSHPGRSAALLAGLAGVDSPRAWELRAAPAAAVTAVLASLRGLASERAFELREKWAAAAPKPVLRGLAAVDHPRAWALRTRLVATCPEALEGFAGSDAAPAWALREAAVARWTARAVRSLGPLAKTPRGHALVAAAIAEKPSDLAVLRASLLSFLASETAPGTPKTPAAPPAPTEVAL